ncbi:hypothetical protein EX895_001540 [Sporisorium graminicola]|uniref:Serine aminopeptidase S33 domain-containing protein n=1 Tax=Sporisorium graminicola TaxID=280036 RepID=A0A4U7KY24_9BASI|nr:hypothetical protein EX895_001540 [Sporisorium graminicola]TKY89755.1 hypothetical protein EX895_001540 [Sporisorium graminicola]
MTTQASTSAFRREDIKFAPGKDLCSAWLYRPTGPPLRPASGDSSFTNSKQYSAMILAHGTGGIKEMGLDRTASKFVELGIICVVFDYRHFGASGGEPRQLLDINLQLQD